VLAPYVENSVVELIEWPVRSTEQFDGFQCDAYRDAIRRSAGSTRWLAIIDLDEFLVPIVDDDLLGCLARFEADAAVGGVCAQWRFFGTSGVERVPDGRLLIETLVRSGAAPTTGGEFPWESGHFKSIVRPERVLDVPSAHFAAYTFGRVHVAVLPELLQINHYWTRDERFLREVKLPRNEKRSVSYEMTHAWAAAMNRHTGFAGPILRFVPRLRAKMGLRMH
jgi:hypothetical protein